MNEFNKTDAQHCLNRKMETNRTIEIRKLMKGHEEEMVFLKNEITFVCKGEIHFWFRDFSEKKVCKGELVFIPVGGVFRYRAESETELLIIHLNRNVILCEGSRIEELYRFTPEGSTNFRPGIYALEINIPLWRFIDGLKDAINDGLICRYYSDLKTRELLILLKVFYAKEDLKNFFSLILSPDTEFSEFVRANYQKCKSVKDLADMMNMLPKQFSEKFLKVFGELPQNWINKERALSVYAELCSGNTAIAAIVEKYKFSSQPHLNKFCMREFGKNPGEIRKKINV